MGDHLHDSDYLNLFIDTLRRNLMLLIDMHQRQGRHRWMSPRLLDSTAFLCNKFFQSFSSTKLAVNKEEILHKGNF